MWTLCAALKAEPVQPYAPQVALEYVPSLTAAVVEKMPT
jgi:hypothetical protein